MHAGDAKRIQEIGHDRAIRVSSGVGKGVPQLGLEVADEEAAFLRNRIEPLYRKVHDEAVRYFPAES